jgi:hypothetical protein
MCTKQCAKCLKTKPFSDFYKQTDRKNGASYCKECFNKYCAKRWTDKKKKFLSELGGCCLKCGYNKHYSALHFHHTDPTVKEYSWNKLRLKSEAAIRKELSTCIILCANCHAEEHWMD